MSTRRFYTTAQGYKFAGPIEINVRNPKTIVVIGERESDIHYNNECKQSLKIGNCKYCGVHDCDHESGKSS
jgi:hypothetical protein